MKSLIIALVTILGLSPVFSANSDDGGGRVDISTNLLAHELLQTEFKQIYLDLTDINQQESLEMWLTLFSRQEENKKSIKRFQEVRAQLRLSEEYEKLVFYYSTTGQWELAIKTIKLFFLNGFSMVNDISLSPHSSYVQRKVRFFDPGYSLSDNWVENLNELGSCIEKTLKRSNKEFDQYSLKNGRAFAWSSQFCIRGNRWSKHISYVLRVLDGVEEYRGAPSAVSTLGLVSGNSVEIHSQNPQSYDAAIELGYHLNRFFDAQHPSGLELATATIEEMKSKMVRPEQALEDFFVDESGENLFFQESHPSLAKEKNSLRGGNIFEEILNSIQTAKELVFIDVFWMGGSLGTLLAKALVRKVIENPEFKVYLITDYENKFNFASELDPVYKYLRAFSESFPKYDFYIVPAQVELKRTALPEFMDLLFTNNVVDNVRSRNGFSAFLEKDGFQLLGKSDHTKVFVVDGLNPEFGVAFVGSKNWTDSSGGIAIDEVVEVRGPAVPVILNAFYYDLYEAFKLDQENGGQMIPLHSLEKGFPHLQHHENITKLLSGVDVLGRHNGSLQSYYSQTQKMDWPARGTDWVSPAQNNVYGTEVSAVEQNVQLILSAKEQIIVDDQFLYDPRIFEAIKFALFHHDVDVYIMLHPLTVPGQQDADWGHVPNNLFLPALISLGAQVKWKNLDTDQEAAILEVKDLHGFEISPEFHPKSLSVDGVLAGDRKAVCGETHKIPPGEGIPTMISGSANKDVMTMSGGFREFQVQVIGDSPVFQHDCTFWARWDDPKETRETNGLDFTIPQELVDAGLGDKEEILDGLRLIFFSLYNFSKKFF